MNSDLVSLIAGIENKILKLQRMVGGKAPMNTNLDMGEYRILMWLTKEIQENMKVTSLHPKFFMIICPELIKIIRERIEMVHLMDD